MQTLPQQSKGFTLIEVMIVMALLAFLSILVYHATVSSFSVNNKLSSESTDLMGMAVTLQALDDDLAQIYTPIFEDPTTAPVGGGDQTPKTFWSTNIRPDGLRRARFVGNKEKISFVANNNIRIQRGTPESDFQLIVWQVSQNKSGTYQLKRFSENKKVFDYDMQEVDTTKPGSYVVVDNLSSAQFSFYRKEGDKWEDSWDSEGASVKSGARYPEMISVKLEGPDPTNPAKQIEWKGVFRPNLKINTATTSKGNNALPSEK